MASGAKRITTATDLVLPFRREVGKVLPRRAREKFWESAFRARWRLPSPPAWSDWSGYERLLVEIHRHRIADVPGDVVEIGVMLGGGTFKLCKYFEREAAEKRVIAIDVFDPSVDTTSDEGGTRMADLYASVLADDVLGGRTQREIFDDVTRDCRNLVVLAADSARVELPCERVAFGYVDGNHSPEYVRSDFELIWDRLSPGGIVAFDDYYDAFPGVTSALHQLIGEHASDIQRVWTNGEKTLLVQRAR